MQNPARHLLPLQRLSRPSCFRRPPVAVLESSRAQTMQVKALYPGTFDPPTNGHVDLIQRGAKIFGHLTVAVLNNRGKNPLFTVAERVEMLQEIVRPLEN